MSNEKIDSKLREELERIERSDHPERTIPVIIEHAAAVNRRSGPGGRADLGGLEGQVRAAQEPLRDRLARLGVTDAEQMTLANALTAELTPFQIRKVAADPEVKRVLWNRAEQVTTPSE